ncbi:putative exocyst complex component 4 [Platanthera guangdongensis]|uniref:Exocyst complex component 4 n=1 Tax=Platanthera guangdongensis TaxID=2320717 RepID=A0ABR2M0Z8_9ASPA
MPDKDDEMPTTTVSALSASSSQPVSKRTRSIKADNHLGGLVFGDGSFRTLSIDGRALHIYIPLQKFSSLVLASRINMLNAKCAFILNIIFQEITFSAIKQALSSYVTPEPTSRNFDSGSLNKEGVHIRHMTEISSSYQFRAIKKA